MKNSINLNEKRLVISRTDSIGDVLLTLPIVSWLKAQFPSVHITFLCRNYTAPIVSCYAGIDEILTVETIDSLPVSLRTNFIKDQKFDAILHVFPKKELAHLFKKAKVESRIGTSHRPFHILTCNIRPNFSRKRSELHESQLNFELLRPFGLIELPTLKEINLLCEKFRVKSVELPDNIESNNSKKSIILHPKSQGSAREWPMEKYVELANQLLELGWVVFFTGTEQEGIQFRNLIPTHTNCIDTTGQLSIEQLITLIDKSTALVACSTGPLHISGFLGKRSIGLFSPKKPIHPGRWKALGEQSIALVFDENCVSCKSKKACNCIADITVLNVLEALNTK